MFYGVVREKVNSCVCGGWFFCIYQFRDIFVLVLLSSLESLWNCDFRLWTEYNVIMYLIYVYIDCIRLDSCCVVNDRNVVYVSCV